MSVRNLDVRGARSGSMRRKGRAARGSRGQKLHCRVVPRCPPPLPPLCSLLIVSFPSAFPLHTHTHLLLRCPPMHGAGSTASSSSVSPFYREDDGGMRAGRVTGPGIYYMGALTFLYRRCFFLCRHHPHKQPHFPLISSASFSLAAAPYCRHLIGDWPCLLSSHWLLFRRGRLSAGVDLPEASGAIRKAHALHGCERCLSGLISV